MRLALLLLTLFAPAAQAATPAVRDASRIVAVGGAITEMIFALGEQGRLVGVDSTSSWPPAAQQLPQVGYQRTLGAEGILSLRPTLVLATHQAGPPSTLEQLRAAGVEVLVLQAGPDAATALDALLSVGQVVQRERAGRALVAKLRERLAAIEQSQSQRARKPGVLFVLSASNGTPLAAGRRSNAHTMITLAGGRNVVDGFDAYRPLNAEAVIGLAPDAILVPDHVLHEAGGREKFLALPGLANTPAGRSGRLIVMDGLFLLGLGPRLADAVTELTQALHAPAGALSAAEQ